MDATGRIELGPLRTIRRDDDDENGDGLSETQLVLVTQDGVRVLANRLALDAGLRFEKEAGGIRFSISTEAGGRGRRHARTTLSEFVTPRN